MRPIGISGIAAALTDVYRGVDPMRANEASTGKAIISTDSAVPEQQGAKNRRNLNYLNHDKNWCRAKGYTYCLPRLFIISLALSGISLSFDRRQRQKTCVRPLLVAPGSQQATIAIQWEKAVGYLSFCLLFF